jgi:hypothetical protein
MNRRSLVLVSVAAAFLSGAVAAEQLPVEGTWQKHDDTFSFAGFTTHYSCVGLESKLKLLLGMVGARPDFKVYGTCADALGAPSEIQVVRMTFYTLAPPGSAAPVSRLGVRSTATTEPGRGEWRAIDWTATRPRELTSGDCELVEQFEHEILPVFTTRGVESHMACVPNQANLSGIRLKFEVLAALPDVKR